MTDLSVCPICQRQKNADSEIVFADHLWIARHSVETNILGYLVLEPRRHFIDLAEATIQEAHSFGTILRQLVGAVKATIKPERVYTFTLAESVPHFHVHIIPRRPTMPRAYRGRGILNYPLQPGPNKTMVQELCQTLRRRLRWQASRH